LHLFFVASVASAIARSTVGTADAFFAAFL